MFCAKCGTECEEGTVFCPSCGEKLEDSNLVGASNAGSVTERQGKFIGKILRGIVVLAVVVLVITGVKRLFFNGGYSDMEDLVDEYCEAFEEKDAEGIIELMLPELVEYAEKQNDSWDKELKEALQKEMDDDFEQLEENCGDDLSFSHKIGNIENEEDTAETLQKQLDFSSGEVFCNQVKVKISVKGDKGEETKNKTLYVVKVKGKWYLGYFY